MALVFCSVLFFFLPWQSVSQMLLAYLSRLSAIADNKINCGPALTWMEVRQHAHLAERKQTSDIPAFKMQNYSDFTLFTVLASNE